MATLISVDPYKAFRFKVLLDEKPVAALSSVSAMTQETEVIEYRAGDDPLSTYSTPGQTGHAPITMERGLTVDRDFHEWASGWDANKDVYDENFRKDVTITLCDENGKDAFSFKVINAWVSEYNPLPDLDALDNAIAIESLTFNHDGWEDQAWELKDGAMGADTDDDIIGS